MRKQKLLTSGILLLVLAVICGFIQMNFYGYLDEDNIVRNSLFMPLSAIFLLLSLLVLTVWAVRTIWRAIEAKKTGAQSEISRAIIKINSNKLLTSGVLLFVLAVICGFIQMNFYGYLDENNIVRDSLFMPLSAIFLFLSLIVLTVWAVRAVWRAARRTARAGAE